MTPIRSLLSCRSATLFCLVAMLSAGSPAAEEPDRSAKHETSKESAVLKRILANWRARQERVKSFHFVMDRRLTIPKEYFAEHRGENGRTEFHDEHSVVRGNEWWVDGNDRIRFEYVLFHSDIGQSGRNSHVVVATAASDCCRKTKSNSIGRANLTTRTC